MDLTPYVESIRRDLTSAAEAGGAEAREIAERLGAALDSAAHLALLDAISNAAAEITRELAPGGVDVRIRGREPEFVVTMPPADVTSTPEESAAEPPPPDEDGTTTRLTLRLPESLKVRIEEAAGRDGLSVNAWLVRVLTAALAVPPRPHPPAGAPMPPTPPTPPNPPTPPSGWPGVPRIGQRITGWVR